MLGEFCRACRPATTSGPGSATVPGPLPSPEQSLARPYPGPATDCRPRRQALPLFLMTSSPSSGLHTSCDGGFAPCEALWRRVVGVSEAWMASFPPIRGDEVAAWGGAVPKTQTTAVKTLKTGFCGRGGLCFGHNVTWYGLLRACGPLNMRVVPLIRT